MSTEVPTFVSVHPTAPPKVHVGPTSWLRFGPITDGVCIHVPDERPEWWLRETAARLLAAADEYAAGAERLRAAMEEARDG